MASGWRGVVAGSLGLILLETVLRTPQATDRTTTAFGDVVTLINKIVDPNTPAFAQKAKTTAPISPGTVPGMPGGIDGGGGNGAVYASAVTSLPPTPTVGANPPYVLV